MTDTILLWFNTATKLFSALIESKEFGSVVIATLCAIGITQLVKMVVIHSPSIPNGPWRIWYLTTAVVGTAITFLLWPTRLGFAWGIGAGTLFAPLTYWICTRLLYRWMPQLESKISATPKGQ